MYVWPILFSQHTGRKKYYFVIQKHHLYGRLDVIFNFFFPKKKIVYKFMILVETN